MLNTDYSTKKDGVKEITLLGIVGPTASGKSALALKIAQKYGGEIITADSRTIYKGMDIGTAKPTSVDQQKVTHWGIDLVEPGQRFSAARFKAYAKAKIKDIQNRGKLPILVGGTGLYIDSVLFDFQFSQLGAKRDKQNPRHLIRIIETSGQLHRRKPSLEPSVLLIGLLPPDEVLKSNIAVQVEGMFAKGVIEETRRLLQKHGEKSLIGTSGIAYRVVTKLLRDEINSGEAVELVKKAHWQYARRQKTWFKRNPHIHWFSSADEAYKFIAQSLNN